jgi:hypothetical protein
MLPSQPTRDVTGNPFKALCTLSSKFTAICAETKGLWVHALQVSVSNKQARPWFTWVSTACLTHNHSHHHDVKCYVLNEFLTSWLEEAFRAFVKQFCISLALLLTSQRELQRCREAYLVRLWELWGQVDHRFGLLYQKIPLGATSSGGDSHFNGVCFFIPLQTKEVACFRFVAQFSCCITCVITTVRLFVLF